MTKDRARDRIIETGRFFQEHLRTILDNRETVLADPDLSDVDIPKLYVRNDLAGVRFEISLHIGELLKLWGHGKLTTECPVCKAGTLHGYYLDMRHSIYSEGDGGTSRFFGVCPSCYALVSYELSGDERYVLGKLAPSSKELDGELLDKAKHRRSPLSRQEMVRVLTGTHAALSEPVIMTKTDRSDAAIQDAKARALRSAADRSLVFLGHLALSRERDKYEAEIARRAAEFDNNDRGR